jgi:glycerol kinase
VGVWPDPNALRELWAEDRRFDPEQPASLRESRRKRWSRAVARAGQWEQADAEA